MARAAPGFALQCEQQTEFTLPSEVGSQGSDAASVAGCASLRIQIYLAGENADLLLPLALWGWAAPHDALPRCPRGPLVPPLLLGHGNAARLAQARHPQRTHRGVQRVGLQGVGPADGVGGAVVHGPDAGIASRVRHAGHAGTRRGAPSRTCSERPPQPLPRLRPPSPRQSSAPPRKPPSGRGLRVPLKTSVMPVDLHWIERMWGLVQLMG